MVFFTSKNLQTARFPLIKQLMGNETELICS